MYKNIKKELSILWFLTTYNLKVIGCAIPYVLAGITIIQLTVGNIVVNDLREHLLALRAFINNDALFNWLYLSDIYNIDSIAYNFNNHLNFSTKLIVIASSAILTLVSIFCSHRSLLNNFVPKYFVFKRAENIFQDLKFMCVWMFFNIIFNIVMLYFSVPSLIFKSISSYLVQNIIFYILIRGNYFGYCITKRDSNII